MKTRSILAALLLISACGDDVGPKGDGDTTNNSTSMNNMTTVTTPDGSCEVDADCEGEEVCFSAMCEPTCAGRAECEDDELCLPRLDGDGSVCQPTECTDNRRCVEFYGAGATCGEDGFCDVPTPGSDTGIQRLKLEDVTQAAQSCDVSDPGSDIAGIGLFDSFGNPRGWASIVSEQVQTDGNDQRNLQVLNGDTPPLDADGCPDTFDGNVLSMGCGGSFIFEFLDSTGAPITLGLGDEITVFEYGGVCSGGAVDDQYSLFSCFGAECSTLLGSGAAIQSFVIE